jgi:hypothetical protein
MSPLLPHVVQALLAAEPQRIDATSWTLEWSAPSQCPGAAEVDGVVAGWRAQAPADVVTTDVRARAVVHARPPDGFALELEIDAEGVVTRHAVTAVDCRALADATALQIAMALGLDPGAPTLVPTPPATAETDAAPAPVNPSTASTPRTTTSSTPVRDRSPGPRGALRVQGSVGTGRVPRIDGRLGLAGALAWPRARIELGVMHTFEQRAEHPDLDVAVRVWQWTAIARGCWTPRVGPLELPVCGGLEAGASQGRAVGVPERETVASAFVAAVAGVGLAWPFARRFALWVEVDGWVGSTQPAFTIEGHDPLFTTRRGGVDGVVGLEVRFP